MPKKDVAVTHPTPGTVVIGPARSTKPSPKVIRVLADSYSYHPAQRRGVAQTFEKGATLPPGLIPRARLLGDIAQGFLEEVDADAQEAATVAAPPELELPEAEEEPRG